MSRASFSSDSLSSSSTDLPSTSECTGGRERGSISQCSVGSADRDDAPTPETVSAKLDDYVAASKEGREAYVRGDFLTAVTQFNQALDLEMQTELECLYDTSIGFVSGLVKQEVNSRLQSSPRHTGAAGGCSRLLEQLSIIYDNANGKSFKKPSEPKWYLRMGAALCLINEWEKAKLVYKEGINMCKDKRELKQALKKLTQIEQITSNAEIPAEDIDDRVLPSSPGHRKVSSVAPTQSLNIERQARPNNVHRKRAKSTVAKRRVNSVDAGIVLEGEKLPRTNSVSAMSPSGRPSMTSDIRKSSDSSIVVKKSRQLDIEPRNKKEKRFSFNLFSSSPKRPSKPPVELSPNTKRHSMGQSLFNTLGRNHRPIPTLTQEDREAWGECFSPVECSVIDYRSFCPSAVVHMRELAVVNDPLYVGGDSLSSGTGGDEDSLEERGECRKKSFNAVKFQSMKIEDDDSELDDD